MKVTTKKVKRFINRGQGSVSLANGSLVKQELNHYKLQRETILDLTQKNAPFTGKDVQFIRTYFSMPIEDFAQYCQVNPLDVLSWEKMGENPLPIDDAMMRSIRTAIFERLRVI